MTSHAKIGSNHEDDTTWHETHNLGIRPNGVGEQVVVFGCLEDSSRPKPHRRDEEGDRSSDCAIRRDVEEAQESLTPRRQEWDWPTLPIPFFAFRSMYEDIARSDWDVIGVGKGLPPFEFADRALLLSALAHPFATVGGHEVYRSVPAKAAALFRGIVKNHGLRDGNKRLAVTTMSVFLLANGWLPVYTNSQLYRYALRVAAHRGAYPIPNIERWLRRHTVLASDADLEILRKQNRHILRGRAVRLAFDDFELP